MIERTTFDLRIAEHSVTTARIDRDDWRTQGHEVVLGSARCSPVGSSRWRRDWHLHRPPAIGRFVRAGIPPQAREHRVV